MVEMIKRENESRNTTESTDSRDSHHVDIVEDVPDIKQFQNLVEINERFKRRPIIFIALFFSAYFLTAILVYSFWTGWSAFDAFYFAVITLETIGYGDFTPTTPSQRLFTCFFLLIGVGFCGSTMAVLRTILTQHQEKLRNLKAARKFSKIEETIMMRESMILDVDRFGDHSITTTESEHNSDFGQSHSKNHPKRKNSVLKTVSTSLKHAARRFTAATGYSTDTSTNTAEANLGMIKNAFLEAHKEELHDLQVSALRNLFFIAVIIGFGTGCMCAIEGWDGITSAYWACVTILTVGFGDVVPTTEVGRGFTICYCLFGCAYLAKSFQDFANVPVVIRLKKNENKVINQFTKDLSKQQLEQIFTSEFFNRVPRLRRWDTEMSKSEFVLMVLTLMNKIEEKDILLVGEVFEKLDNGKGYLSMEEMQEKVANAPNEIPEPPEDADMLDIVTNITTTMSNTVSNATTNLTNNLNNAVSRVSIAFRESEVIGTDGRFSIFRRKSQASTDQSIPKPSGSPRKVRSRDERIASFQLNSPLNQGNPSSNGNSNNNGSSSSSISMNGSPGMLSKRLSAFRPESTETKSKDLHEYDESNETSWTINPINSNNDSNSNDHTRPTSLSQRIRNHSPAFGSQSDRSSTKKPEDRRNNIADGIDRNYRPSSMKNLFGAASEIDESGDGKSEATSSSSRGERGNQAVGPNRASPLRSNTKRGSTVSSNTTISMTSSHSHHPSNSLVGTGRRSPLSNLEIIDELGRPSEEEESITSNTKSFNSSNTRTL